MSRAFFRESDGQWLEDVIPTLSALVVYLTRENNGIRVVEERRTIDTDGREVYHMSNGLSYVKNPQGKWSIAKDEQS